MKKPERKYSELTKLAIWSRKVRDRDNDTCQFPKCLKPYVAVEAHHIRGRGAFPEEKYRLDPDNGISLCREHHRYCHDNPKEAERLGFRISRTSRGPEKSAPA